MWFFAGCLAFTTSMAAYAAEKLEYNRDIRPILSDACFACHGPDGGNRQAGLRLDRRDAAIAEADSGAIAIVPGKSAESELIVRVTSTDNAVKMPPAESLKHVTPAQIELLRRWIDEGAEYQEHWAFLPIRKPEIAEPGSAAIDRFVAMERERQALPTSPEADPATLARRVAFDLTGLPPTEQQVSRLSSDPSDANYEQLVDELLASPRFGERMAIWWLDLVRYADSVGYHGDPPITMFPFRDWVIESFNSNKHFDEFTREQIAGDLLPNPQLSQKIAASYNRLGMMSAEGGAQAKEYLAKYAAERVRNIGGAWLGITTGCCECHDHKFDPMTTRDFYSMEAFFADIEEHGVYTGERFRPKMPLPTPDQKVALDAADAELAVAKKKLKKGLAAIGEIPADWESSLTEEQIQNLPQQIREILGTPQDKRTKKQQKALLEYYRSVAPSLAELRDLLANKQAARKAVDDTIVKILITNSIKPRTIRILPRGNWMDDSGDIVEPATPAFLPKLPAKEGRLTRLDLADWLVSRENPLTARTLVNRLWALYFGAGLSRKLDDLGAQGEWPSHPELVEWLAADLVDHEWDLKRTIKQIVMSKTYRQSSKVSAPVLEKDPFNRWLARQGRFRLDAEMVRDNALWVSGLLAERIGGPSVKPYQPPGYWAHLNFPEREWHNDKGENLYRRSLYTHWQRQYLHPSLLAFDAPSREECTAERVRSNTPLQSLVLLNDPIYVEAARVLAERVILEGGEKPEERIDYAFRRALSRPVKPGESEVLVPLLEQHLAHYKTNTKAAEELLTTGDRPKATDLDPAELAAWTSIARTILNLHGVVTRN